MEIHVHVRIYMFTTVYRSQKCAHVWMYVYMYVYIIHHIYIHTCMHTYIHTYIHLCMYALVHAYVHVYIYTYMHTHTCIHTYIQQSSMHLYMLAEPLRHWFAVRPHNTQQDCAELCAELLFPRTGTFWGWYEARRQYAEPEKHSLRCPILVELPLHEGHVGPTYMHACIHTYIHTDRYTYIQTYIHTYIHTDTLHTHIYICAPIRAFMRDATSLGMTSIEYFG